jgi:DNA-binding response OmpR family regulator
LRAKVDRDFSRELIHTIRGAGYCIRHVEETGQNLEL